MERVRPPIQRGSPLSLPIFTFWFSRGTLFSYISTTHEPLSARASGTGAPENAETRMSTDQIGICRSWCAEHPVMRGEDLPRLTGAHATGLRGRPGRAAACSATGVCARYGTITDSCIVWMRPGECGGRTGIGGAPAFRRATRGQLGIRTLSSCWLDRGRGLLGELTEEFCPSSHVRFPVDRPQICVDGLRRYVEARGDLLAGQSVGDQP